MDRNANLLRLIPVSKQMILIGVFFAPILIWKHVETGIAQEQIVFLYCFMILCFFQTLKASRRVRQWMLEKEIPEEVVFRALRIPLWVWSFMTLASFAYAFAKHS